MRLLLAGGRHLDDVGMIRRALDRAHAMGPAEVLIHGGAGVLGVTAEDWARERRLHVVRYPANWREFGKRAESLRDGFMLADSRPDLVLALPGGGDTRALVARALAAGLSVIDAEGRAVPAGDAPRAVGTDGVGPERGGGGRAGPVGDRAAGPAAGRPGDGSAQAGRPPSDRPDPGRWRGSRVTILPAP